MTLLLISEPPLQVLPTLAVHIGLNEAIVLQQIHYWIHINKQRGSESHFIENRWWTYNSVDEWANQFPFWSASTVRRTLANLRKAGLVRIGKFNKDEFDQTLWYTIDYEALSHLVNMNKSSCSFSANIELLNLNTSTNTETNNTETNNITSGDGPKKITPHSKEVDDFFDLWETYPFKPTTPARTNNQRRKVATRLNNLYFAENHVSALKKMLPIAEQCEWFTLTWFISNDLKVEKIMGGDYDWIANSSKKVQRPNVDQIILAIKKKDVDTFEKLVTLAMSLVNSENEVHVFSGEVIREVCRADKDIMLRDDYKFKQAFIQAYTKVIRK